MTYAGFCQPKGATNTVEYDGKSCTHQVAYPDGQEGSDAPPAAVEKLAKSFPFEIDPFQRTAAYALEGGDSVLVAAHTSAGKTVVAQYAIAMALRDGSRVIYTSPLKALSNQKFKEFSDEFNDVGLMTGDISINPEASCIVMTTEILRSMLYHGSEIVREVQLLVYDEIHYIKDQERGVVWEESIILLPHQCQYAFLSATIPNAFEFAHWIANIHKKKCHVIYTEYRPVPLQHYIMPCGSRTAALHCVVDQDGRFKEGNFQNALAAVGSADEAVDSKQKKATNRGEESEIYQLCKLLVERRLDPVIVFALSKRQCEDLAAQLVTMQLNDEDEARLVERVFRSAVDVLTLEDQQLPQVTAALPMLQRGIGVHHSGLLPIVKEIIEVLFGEGLVKVLFATETFSTGLNMPARCVCFAGVRKFDGASFRNLTGGEYIQMSGRAGRRGLDASGTVILMCDQKLEPAVAKDIVRGRPDPLRSAFRITYTMLLNTLRLDVADVKPELLITHSLRQHQTQAALPALRMRLEAAEAAVAGVQLESERDAAELFHLLKDRAALEAAVQGIVVTPAYAVPFLQPGRLVRLLHPSQAAVGAALDAIDRSDDVPRGVAPSVWAAVVSFERVPSNRPATAGTTHVEAPVATDADEALTSAYIVDVLVMTEPSPAAGAHRVQKSLLAHDSNSGTPLVVAIPLQQIAAFGAPRIILPKAILTHEDRAHGMRTVAESIQRLESRFGRVPMLDPEKDMRVKSSKYKKLQMRLDRLDSAIKASPLSNETEDERDSRLKKFQYKENLRKEAQRLRLDVRDAESMILSDDLAARMSVLRRLGFLDSENVPTRKGHVAAGISAGDGLVLTELLFAGALSRLTAVQLASLLSCFVWSADGDRGGVKVRDELQGAFGAMRDVAKHVGRVQRDCGVACDVDAFMNSFRADIMDIVMLWASGESFLHVKRVAKRLFEGSLVRAFRRLHELLLQVQTSCDILGETSLSERCQEAASKMHRDVVFAASLYL